MLNISPKKVNSWIDGAIRSTLIKGDGKQVKLQSLTDFVEHNLQPDSSPAYCETVRIMAMLKLSAFIDNPEVIPLLTELLQYGESTKIRGYAAISLGQSGDPRAIDPLTKAMNDPDSQVSNAVQKSLNRLYEIIEELKQSESKK